MSGPSTINFAVADSRYEMTNGTATLKATQAAPGARANAAVGWRKQAALGGGDLPHLQFAGIGALAPAPALLGGLHTRAQASFHTLLRPAPNSTACTALPATDTSLEIPQQTIALCCTQLSWTAVLPDTTPPPPRHATSPHSTPRHPTPPRCAVYPWQALDIKGNPTKPRNASAKLGFVLATNGAASAAANASGITWASIGASASVSPPPASATASTMTFPTTPSGGGNGSEATVVITPSAGVTLLGLSMSLPKGAAGLLKLSIELAGPANGSGPAAVTYPLAAPVPVNFNVYAGAGLFGTGYTITKATVSASQVTKGAALTLGAFDASVTPHAPVTLVALPVKRGAGARAARTTSALPAHSRGVAAPARERRP